MIIHTTNDQLAALLAPYSLRMPDDNHAFVMAPATVQQLDRLATVLTTKYAGQWSVEFDGEPANLSYEDLTENIDGDTWQAFMLAPGYIGADTEDLINFIENVYGQPVTNDNHKRVAQFFRFWYASTHPDEYHSPPAAPPAKYAELDLTSPPGDRGKSQRHRQRLANAAKRLGFATMNDVAKAINALSNEDAAAIAGILRKS